MRFGSRDHLVRLASRSARTASRRARACRRRGRAAVSARMARVRRGDVHRVDVGVVGQRFVAAEAIAGCRTVPRTPAPARAIANRPRPPCRRRPRACPRRSASRSHPGRRCPSESPVAPHASPSSAASDPRTPARSDAREPLHLRQTVLRSPDVDRAAVPVGGARGDGMRRSLATVVAVVVLVGGSDRRRLDGVDAHGRERGHQGRDQDRDHVPGSRGDPQRHQHEPR